MPHRVAFLGFTEFERKALSAFFRQAPERSSGYAHVANLTDAELLVADADHAPSVQLVEVTERLDDTVFVGSVAPEGATSWLARPFEASQILRALDALVARRQPPATVPDELQVPTTIVQAMHRRDDSAALLLGDLPFSAPAPEPRAEAAPPPAAPPAAAEPAFPSTVQVWPPRPLAEPDVALDQLTVPLMLLGPRPADSLSPLTLRELPSRDPADKSVRWKVADLFPDSLPPRHGPARETASFPTIDALPLPAAPAASDAWVEPAADPYPGEAPPPVREPVPAAPAARAPAAAPTPVAPAPAPVAPVARKARPAASPPVAPAADIELPLATPPTLRDEAPAPRPAAPPPAAKPPPKTTVKPAENTDKTDKPPKRPKATLLPGHARALLVDDSAIALLFLEKRLERWQLALDQAGNSQAALALLAQNSYDIVFLDVELGDESELDGLGLCRQIKQTPALMSTLVVMVTAHHSELDRVRGTLAGCDAYLGKPLDEAELQRLLERQGLQLKSAAGVLPE